MAKRLIRVMKFRPAHALVLTFLSALLGNCFVSKDSISRKEFPVESTLGLDSTVLGISIVADSLTVPWDIAWGPDSNIIMSEQSGIVKRLDLRTGKVRQLLKINGVWLKRTSGLLGMTLHPDMKKQPFVFVHYTTREGKDSSIYSRLVRYRYHIDTLTNPKTLLNIEGGIAHNGSRLAFSKDGKLLWATGDNLKDGYAQDSTILNGKILRLNTDGSVPDDNPIKGSYVWAWGFRNMQGLAVAPNGNIYTSEHGDAIEDELNLIRPLNNYGWPQIAGFHNTREEQAIAHRHNRTEPLKSWTPTIAPAGIAVYHADAVPEWQNSLLLTTLKDRSIRVLKLNPEGSAIISETVYLESKYGRLRDICVSPSGDIYVATSNRDWNTSPGFPVPADDRIIRLSKLRTSRKEAAQINAQQSVVAQKVSGAVLYTQYCASCHKENGEGIPLTFPPLNGAEQVLGDKSKLVDILLNGLTGPVVVKGNTYNQAMPAFSFLTDQELSSIATYVRNSWGNNASAVNIQDIKNSRQK